VRGGGGAIRVVESSVAIFTAVHPTNPVLLTFNILAFVYENPVLPTRNYVSAKRFIPSLFLARRPPVGQGLLIHKVPGSHTDAPQSVGLLWMSDQLVAVTSTWQHTTVTTDRQTCPRWDSNPQSQRPQIYSVDRAASGTGDLLVRKRRIWAAYATAVQTLVSRVGTASASPPKFPYVFLRMNGRQNAKSDFRIIAIIIIIVVIVVTIDFFHRLATCKSHKGLVGKCCFRITWCVYVWGIVSNGWERKVCSVGIPELALLIKSV
jgi:hypothetical protein